MNLHTGDNQDWGRTLPDDSIDLLITSPPYLEARDYGIGAGRKIDAWVSWMTEFVRVFAPKVKGLMAIVCEGQTRDFRYQPAPFLLMADLHRAGYNLRKPAIYKRDGIPGSGGPDWLKNKWEPIICITRKGRLPWSDPTACGHPPVCKPGGRPSNRTKGGSRLRDGEYKAPLLANPGNIIDCGSGGGGQMGSEYAHENEAPFPLKLADFFVRSFCPPRGVVCDPFLGSGTVAEAALVNGRDFVGGDIRESQLEITRKRLAAIPSIR